ncbi:MAG TPA: response regulator [Acidimicrobiia bacterium]|nr:response regulator [Acidimicrobiia bacterium]
MSVTVLLVDDVPELRTVLRRRLRLRGGFDVVADVGDGASAVAAAGLHQPDIIVLDLGLPDLAGHEVLSRLRVVARDAQILVYTGSVSRDRFVLARDVDAYVSKDQDVTYLVELLVELNAKGRQSAKLDLGPAMSDVRLARDFLSAHCARWGCDDILEDGQLVVSELVTNAVVHAGQRCELGIVFRNGWLRVEVRDRGTGGPEVQAPSEGSEHGRGLLLVSAMTKAWGVEPLAAGGKVVWAELRSASHPEATRDQEGAESARRSGGGPFPSGPVGSGPGFCFASRMRRPRRPDRVASVR